MPIAPSASYLSSLTNLAANSAVKVLRQGGHQLVGQPLRKPGALGLASFDGCIKPDTIYQEFKTLAEDFDNEEPKPRSVSFRPCTW
jgi:hypothetical protein